MDGCMDEEDTQYAFVTRRSNSTHQLVMPIISYCMPPSVVKQSSKKSIAHSIHFPFSLSRARVGSTLLTATLYVT